MTHITRVFNPSTRSLTGVERKYAGQVGDSISTVLHFEYTQLGFLSEYVPYIQFGVYDESGNQLIFGPMPENPSEVMQTALEDRVYFDGVEFTIPWSVTSRVKSARVDYQLFFVKVGVEFDGRNVAQLKPTEIVMSAIDSIALKPSITCDKRKPAPCCPPFAPTGAEPNILGWINLWKDYGIVVPATQDLIEPEFLDRFGVPFDPTEQDLIDNPPIIKLNFSTYSGKNDSSVELRNVPVMVDGKIIYYQLPYGNTEKTIPLLRGTIEDGQSIVYSSESEGFVAYDVKGIYQFRGTCSAIELDAWEDAKAAGDRPLENGDVYSCTDDRYYGVDEQGNKELYKAGTNWVWSEQERFEPLTGEMDLTRYQLESAKIDNWDALADDPEVVSEKFYPTARLVKISLDDKLDDGQLIRDWSSEMTDEMIPSAPLVKASLDDKLDDDQLVQALTRVENDIPSTRLLGEELDKKLDDTQLVQDLTRLEDDIPSTALLGTELDRKTDKVMAVPFWDASLEYSEGSTVVYDGTLYISTAGPNIGNVPVDETGEQSVFWDMVKGSGGGGGGGSGTISEIPTTSRLIGNGVDKQFTIRHNLGTREVFVVTRDLVSNELVYPRYEVTGVGTVVVHFTDPPAKQSYRVTVAPAVNVAHESPDAMDFENLNTWTATHELGKAVMVQTFESDGSEIIGEVTVNDGYTVEVRFNHAHTGFMVIR